MIQITTTAITINGNTIKCQERLSTTNNFGNDLKEISKWPF